EEITAKIFKNNNLGDGIVYSSWNLVLFYDRYCIEGPQNAKSSQLNLERDVRRFSLQK
uniref:Uncharacterized protein n=1 Tax=Ciona intestinalis TaxID=7719 RepID=H2XMA4_CIOIN